MRRDINLIHYSRLYHLLERLREAPEDEKLYWRYRILKMRMHITTEEFIVLRMQGVKPLDTFMCRSCNDIYSPLLIKTYPNNLKVCVRCHRLYTFEELPNVKDNQGNAVYVRRVRSVRK